MRYWIRTSIVAAMLAGGGIGGGKGYGRFINSAQPMPDERVIKNTEAWIKEKPDDAQAWYVLGRVHAMVWAYGAELSLVPPEQPVGLPGFTPYQEVQVRHPEKPPTDAEIEHLK